MNELTRRDFVRGGLTAGIGIGIAPELLRSAVAQQAAPAPAAGADPYALVDPELLAAVKQFPFPTQSFTSETLAVVRKWPGVPPLPSPAPQPFERHIPGPTGAPDLRLVIVDPAPGTKGRPAFLHMHGGGYVSGFAGQFNPFLQAVAQNCGCLVVSVDYRLAPETHFPGSLEDNYAALRWLYKNSDELGVDRKRIAIGGESAGGSHAVMLAIAARDRREIPILFQLLLYPALDDRTGSTRQPSAVYRAVRLERGLESFRLDFLPRRPGRLAYGSGRRGSCARRKSRRTSSRIHRRRRSRSVCG